MGEERCKQVVGGQLQKAVNVFDRSNYYQHRQTQPEVIQKSNVVQQLRLLFGFVYL
jgi:hypothetical protein